MAFARENALWIASPPGAAPFGARVLTVTGYGGTGKTRFAIELFRRLASEHAGGAAFISLASVTAAGALDGLVAHASALSPAAVLAMVSGTTSTPN